MNRTVLLIAAGFCLYEAYRVGDVLEHALIAYLILCVLYGKAAYKWYYRFMIKHMSNK